MKKLLVSVAALSALAMSSSSAFAICVAQGEITRILVNPLDALTVTIWVRPSNPGSLTHQFTTSDIRVTSAATAAQGSHERVRVTGLAGQCSAPSLGLSQGGDISAFIVAPEI